MAQQSLMLKVTGIPTMPSITEINARNDASTVGDIPFKIPVGTTDVAVIEVKEDLEKKADDNGKVYQWFRAQFPQGTGWVRADLVDIQGDGSAVGYGVVSTYTRAQDLNRQTGTVPQGAETQSAPAPSASSEVSSATAPSTASEVSTASTPTTSSEVSAPATSPAPATSTSASGPGTAKIMSSPTGKVRPGPGTGHNPPVTSINYGETCEVLGAKMGDDGIPLYWVNIRYNGQEGWIREDLVRMDGNFAEFGLNAPDKYPNPAQQSRWVRGFDLENKIWNTGSHWGWDHGGDKGVALTAGPNGGVVYKKAPCQKCGPNGMSTVEAGLGLYNQGVYSDPGWNFGYGNYVIVGYENSKLPASTQKYLSDNGRAGQHIFVMHAHCQNLMVEDGTQLSPGQQIATLGNSGNSEGAHLHLELRISPTMNPASWAALKDGLSSPGVLFKR